MYKHTLQGGHVQGGRVHFYDNMWGLTEPKKLLSLVIDKGASALQTTLVSIHHLVNCGTRGPKM